MKTKDIHIGGTYAAQISGNVVGVRIVRTHPTGVGWVGVNTKTMREVRIKSGRKLRSEITPPARVTVERQRRRETSQARIHFSVLPRQINKHIATYFVWQVFVDDEEQPLFVSCGLPLLESDNETVWRLIAQEGKNHRMLHCRANKGPLEVIQAACNHLGSVNCDSLPIDQWWADHERPQHHYEGNEDIMATATKKKKTPKKTPARKKKARPAMSRNGHAKKPAAKKKAAAKRSKMSQLDAAAKVLQGRKNPLTSRELIEQMAAKKYWKSPGGKTPHATLTTAIARDIAKNGKKSRFKKVGPGQFAHR